jgi:hypothetical protein
MGLAERLAVEPVVKPQMCAVGRLLELLPEVEAVALQEAINKVRGVDPTVRKGRSEGYTAVWLTNVLKDEGIVMSRHTVTRHVARECSCGS